MKKPLAFLSVLIFFGCLVCVSTMGRNLGLTTAESQARAQTQHDSKSAPRVCAECIQAHEEFLASDALRGRGSGTHDELLAATYIASQLRQYGIEPAGDNGGYIQRVPLIRRKLSGMPQMTLTTSGDGIPAKRNTLAYGKEFLVLNLIQTEFSGRLQKVNVDQNDPKIVPGSMVLIAGKDESKLNKAVLTVISAGALAVMIPVRDNQPGYFEEARKSLPDVPPQLEGEG